MGQILKLNKIILEFNNYCNYQCSFCRSGQGAEKILRLKDFKDFDYYIQSADMIDITGYGEITIHSDFEEIIKRITEYKKPIFFSTNGSMLTPHIIHVLEKSSLDVLNISINSLNPDIYRKLSGGHEIEPVLRNFVNVHRSKLRNIRHLQSSFVINKLNFHEIKDFIDFGLAYDIHIRFNDLTSTIKDYSPELILEDNEENRKYLKEWIVYSQKRHCRLNYFNFEHRNTKQNRTECKDILQGIIRGCEYIDKIIAINSDGSVKACCWTPDLNIGNVKENTLEEIMNGPIYNDLRENIKQGSFKYCENCRRLG
jgi:MoaA/NifB/PqqE/SkfB family radical SAM enzyme